MFNKFDGKAVAQQDSFGFQNQEKHSAKGNESNNRL